MYRRFLVALFRRCFAAFLLICLGCSAQSGSPDLNRKIERQVRSFYSLPPNVKVVVGPTKPSEVPNYDALSITLEGNYKKSTYDLLLSKDGNTLIRLTKMTSTRTPSPRS